MRWRPKLWRFHGSWCEQSLFLGHSSVVIHPVEGNLLPTVGSPGGVLGLLKVSSRERFLIWRIYVKPGAVIGKQGMQMEEHLSVLDLSSDLNNRVLRVEAELCRMDQVGRLLYVQQQASLRMFSCPLLFLQHLSGLCSRCWSPSRVHHAPPPSGAEPVSTAAFDCLLSS